MKNSRPWEVAQSRAEEDCNHSLEHQLTQVLRFAPFFPVKKITSVKVSCVFLTLEKGRVTWRCHSNWLCACKSNIEMEMVYFARRRRGRLRNVMAAKTDPTRRDALRRRIVK